jgi:pimeloyl-ACP methyl ester carboxylesterase
LLVSDSGSQDRDAAVFGHRPFLVLADHLTRLGVAVLRLDDRGAGASTGEAAATPLDEAADVEAGLAYLRGRPEIDGGRIGLVGHGEGGCVASTVAAREQAGVGFVVLLAARGVDGERMLYLQNERVARSTGLDEGTIARQRAIQERLVGILRDEPDDLLARVRMLDAVRRMTEGASPAERLALGFGDDTLEARLAAMATPAFRSFLTSDPGPILARVRCPVLALNGEHDVQVPAQENVGAIRAALAAGGNQNVEVSVLPGLNHLFQTDATGSPLAYGRIEETFSPLALSRIGDWILATVAPLPSS